MSRSVKKRPAHEVILEFLHEAITSMQIARGGRPAHYAVIHSSGGKIQVLAEVLRRMHIPPKRLVEVVTRLRRLCDYTKQEDLRDTYEALLVEVTAINKAKSKAKARTPGPAKAKTKRKAKARKAA